MKFEDYNYDPYNKYILVNLSDDDNNEEPIEILGF